MIVHKARGFLGLLFLLACFTLVYFPAFGQGSNVEHLATMLGNDYIAVGVQGNYAYCAGGRGLDIIDVSIPSEPILAGRYDPPHRWWAVNDVAIAGHYAYIGTDESLRIVDISNPTNPIEVGVCYAVEPKRVIIANQYAYVTEMFEGFHIIDISSPAHPSVIGSCAIAHTGYALAVEGNYAYVGELFCEEGFRVIDVGDPTNPTEVGAYITPGWVEGIEIAGNYAYVADLRELLVVDISNPANLIEVARYGTPGQARDVKALGNYAYVADGDEGLYVLNISNPSNPVEVGVCDTPGHAERIVVVGIYAYVADGTGGLRCISVSNPANPTELGSYNTIGGVRGVTVMGDYAYSIDSFGGWLWVINISTPTNPITLGSYNLPGRSRTAYDVTVRGKYVYLVSDWGELRVIDVIDPSNPIEVGTCSTSGFAYGVAVVGDYAYVADGCAGGFTVINIRDSTNPFKVGAWDTLVGARKVAVLGGYAYVAGESGGLRIIDVHDPTNPTEVGACATYFALDVKVIGNYAYVADSYSGLRIIDISNPTNPTEVGVYNTPGQARGIAVEGDHAYVADESGGLRIIDVHNPRSPIEVGYYDTRYAAYDVALGSGFICVGERWAMEILRFQPESNPLAQQLEAFVERSSESINELLRQVQGENGLGTICEYFKSRVKKLARDQLNSLMLKAITEVLGAYPSLVGDPFILIPLAVWQASKEGKSMNAMAEALSEYAQRAIAKMEEELELTKSHLSELTEEKISEFSQDFVKRGNAHRLLTSIIFSEKSQLELVKQAAETGEPWELVERLFSIPTFLIGRLFPYSWPVTLPLTVLSTLRTLNRMDAATANWVAAISALSSAEYAMMDIYENTIRALNMVASNEDPSMPRGELKWLGHQLCDYDEQFGSYKGALGAKASSMLWIKNPGSVHTGYKLIVTYMPAMFEPLKVVQEEVGIEANGLEVLTLKYTEAGERRRIMVGGQEIIVTRYTGTPPSQNAFLTYYVFMRTKTGLYAADIDDTLDWNWEEFKSSCPSPDPDVEIPSVISIGVRSPVALCVYDASGNVTGTVNGEIREEIPGSMAYEDGVVLLFDLTKAYTYVVTGTEQGTYGVTIAAVEEGQTTRFSASEIPISPSGVHQYTIDWDALSQGKEGVTVQIDSDGDGIFERTITSDSELTGDEFGVVQAGKLLNHGPNPVPPEGCIFWLDLPDDTVDATLKIFDIDGALLVSVPLDPTADRYPAAGRWLPQDDQGRLLGTGLYLYLVEIEHADGNVTCSPVQKMVIQR